MLEVQKAPADAVVMVVIARPQKDGMQVFIRSEDSNMVNNHMLAHAAVQLTGTCQTCDPNNAQAGYAKA